MGTTNILPFANGASADVQSDDTYKANAPTGFVPGPAYPNQANKALRQSSAVAAAVARLVTDSEFGNQNFFNDNEDVRGLADKIRAAILTVADIPGLSLDRDNSRAAATALYSFMIAPALGGQIPFVYTAEQPYDIATKLAQAIYNLPAIKLNNIVADLFKRFLASTSINPGEASKFTDDKLLSYTPAQLSDLVANSIYKTILTRKGILEVPPVSDWKSVDQSKVTPYTDVGGYVFIPNYRVLANGMVEIRCGFLRGFRPKTGKHIFLIGSIPNKYSPCSGERRTIVGSAFDSKYDKTIGGYAADMSVRISAVSYDAQQTSPNKPDTDIFITYTDQTLTTIEPWSIVYGDSGYNPWGKSADQTDPNAYIGTTVSLTYMPRFS